MQAELIDTALSERVAESWERFIELAEPLRPELFRFALRLTRNAFDAEDLVHDGLLRAFGTPASGRIRNPRAYLFRILSNLWIDELRRSRPESAGGEEEQHPDPKGAGREDELRDAAERTLGVLSPRERVAVVLKDAFGLSHAEIAEVISSSEGAVKVALHRGRRRLAEERERPARRPRVSRDLVDRFVEAFRAHDLESLRPLLLETVESEVFPCGVGVGRDHAEQSGWLRGSFYHHSPEHEARGELYPRRFDVQVLEGEPVVLVFRDDGTGEALEELWRFEEDDGQIARVRDYCFSPDLVRWVAEQLDLPVRSCGYRFRPWSER